VKFLKKNCEKIQAVPQFRVRTAEHDICYLQIMT